MSATDDASTSVDARFAWRRDFRACLGAFALENSAVATASCPAVGAAPTMAGPKGMIVCTCKPDVTASIPVSATPDRLER
jgi:hypothetical protein